MALAACGGDDSSESRGRLLPKSLNSTKDTVDRSVEEEADDDEVKVGKATALVPHDVTAPSGFRMVRAECEADGEPAISDGEPTEYFTPFTHAVPEGWTLMGRSSGGSGSTLGTDVSLHFTLEDGSDVTVEFEGDNLGPDGEVLDYDGMPWKSFDYDTTVGDAEARIVYEKVATVPVKDQTIDLWYMNAAQAPEHVSSNEYKARVSLLELPTMFSEEPAEHSVVFTIRYGDDTTEVTQDVVETIIASLSLPTCQWDEILEDEEVFLQMDLNGDGKVKSIQEMQEELQAELDSMADD